MKILIKLSITILIFATIVWLSKSSYTSKSVIIKEIYNNEILVESVRGVEQYITIPQIITNLIDVNTESIIRKEDGRTNQY